MLTAIQNKLHAVSQQALQKSQTVTSQPRIHQAFFGLSNANLTGPATDTFTRITAVTPLTFGKIKPRDDSELLLSTINDILCSGKKVRLFFDLDGTLDRKRWLINEDGQSAPYNQAVDVETIDLVFQQDSQELIRTLCSTPGVEVVIHTARDGFVNPGEITEQQVNELAKQGITGITAQKGKLEQPVEQIFHMMPVLKELITEGKPIKIMAMMGGYLIEGKEGKPVITREPMAKEKVAAQWIFNTLLDEGLLQAEPVKDNALFYKSAYPDSNAYLEIKSAALCYHGRFAAEGDPLTQRYKDLMKDAKNKFGVAYETHNSGVHGVSELEAVPATYDKGKGLELFMEQHPDDKAVPIMVGDSSSDSAGGQAAIDHQPNPGYFVVVNQPHDDSNETSAQLLAKITKDYPSLATNDRVFMLPEPTKLVKTLNKVPELAKIALQQTATTAN